MTLSKSELIDNYVKDIRNKVMNFDLKVQTSLLLFNFFKSKSYDFYFIPKLKHPTNNDLVKSPDFYASRTGRVDILGEIKQSLPNPLGDNYEKKSGKDIEQVKAYKEGSFVKISTPRDVFFAAPDSCNEAIEHYINKIESDPKLKDNVVILRYYFSSGASHNRLTIRKAYGKFSDEDIEAELRHKNYQVGDGDLAQIQGYYKILYTEEKDNGTEVPIEYVMMVIWHNIIPELIKTSDFNKTIERIRMGENTLEFSISQLKEILDNMYTLRTSSNTITEQFSKKLLIEAMKAFEKLNKAKAIEGDLSDPKYRIVFGKIADRKRDLLDFIIRELNKEEFQKRAEVEYKKLTNQNLDIP